MKKILKWIKEHVRPYVKFNRNTHKIGNADEVEDKIDALKDNTEVGIKFWFKF